MIELEPIEAAMKREAAWRLADLERGLGMLLLVARLLPALCILGTAIGHVTIWQLLSTLSVGGIAEAYNLALITSHFPLVVAAVFYVGHGLLRALHQRLSRETLLSINGLIAELAHLEAAEAAPNTWERPPRALTYSCREERAARADRAVPSPWPSVLPEGRDPVGCRHP